VVTDTHIHFPHFGNSLSETCHLILAVHSNTEEKCKPIKLQTPPQLAPRPIGRYLWAPFNQAEHAVSYSKDDKSFNNHAINDNGMPPLHASTPSDAQLASCPDGVRVKYYLYRRDDNPANLVGATVVSTDGHCPPFNPVANTNIFGHYFRIEYICDGSTYVRAILPFKFVSCFRLSDKLTYTLSQPANAFCLDAAVQHDFSANFRGDPRQVHLYLPVEF
jgi:hypothetical protein